MASNIAFGQDVALNGVFFTGDYGWGGGVMSSPERIVNGIFAPESYQWNKDGIWWNGNENPDNNIVIDLGEFYTINSFVVQADNNDTYRLSYLGLDSGWYDIPAISGWGLITRPEFFLASPIIASQLKFIATGGDGLYSVSQIVANGSLATVPEPATMLLFGIGTASLTCLRRRHKKA